ncbi:MAG TPA: hypothetical protein VE262_11960 [Blastocatellia bacterium]|nr:hypothetical protein [Blastocatellia bacterium]
MAIKPEIVDQLLKECDSPDELLGQDGLLQQLTKRESPDERIRG